MPGSLLCTAYLSKFATSSEAANWYAAQRLRRRPSVYACLRCEGMQAGYSCHVHACLDLHDGLLKMYETRSLASWASYKCLDIASGAHYSSRVPAVSLVRYTDNMTRQLGGSGWRSRYATETTHEGICSLVPRCAALRCARSQGYGLRVLR